MGFMIKNFQKTKPQAQKSSLLNIAKHYKEITPSLYILFHRKKEEVTLSNHTQRNYKKTKLLSSLFHNHRYKNFKQNINKLHLVIDSQKTIIVTVMALNMSTNFFTVSFNKNTYSFLGYGLT